MITQPSGMVDVVHLELQLDDLFFFFREIIPKPTMRLSRYGGIGRGPYDYSISHEPLPIPSTKST